VYFRRLESDDVVAGGSPFFPPTSLGGPGLFLPAHWPPFLLYLIGARQVTSSFFKRWFGSFGGVSYDIPVVAPSPEAADPHRGLTPRPLFNEDVAMRDQEARITEHRIRQANAETPVLPRSFVATMAMSEQPTPLPPQRKPAREVVDVVSSLPIFSKQAARARDTIMRETIKRQVPVHKAMSPEDDMGGVPQGWTAYPIERKRV
jgi:hypothetical protein